MGPSGAALVASEKSGLFLSYEGHVGISLVSLTVNRDLSRVQLVDSVFHTSIDRDLELPIKLQLASQASSGDEAGNSAFFSRISDIYVHTVLINIEVIIGYGIIRIEFFRQGCGKIVNGMLYCIADGGH